MHLPSSAICCVSDEGRKIWTYHFRECYEWLSFQWLWSHKGLRLPNFGKQFVWIILCSNLGFLFILEISRTGPYLLLFYKSPNALSSIYKYYVLKVLRKFQHLVHHLLWLLRSAHLLQSPRELISHDVRNKCTHSEGVKGWTILSPTQCLLSWRVSFP